MSDTLLVVDAMAYIYRAYFAIRSLSTRDGTATNAVFGFIKALDQLTSDFRPSHRVVVFDGGLPPARLALLPEYKAQRDPMPDALRGQLPLVEDYLAASGVATLRLDRCEADDVMATLASRVQAPDRVLLATRDKDMFQLVNERVFIALPGSHEVMDAEGVERKMGVRPDQIVDWLALIGDASDNIKGVPGVGVKTATTWLQRYGNLECVYENVHALGSDRWGPVLETCRPLLARNRELMRLQCDLELSAGWDAFRKGLPDRSRMIAFLTKMEFTSLLNEFQAGDDLFGNMC